MPSVKDLLKAAGNANLGRRRFSKKPTKMVVLASQRVKAIAGQRLNKG